MTTGSDWRVPEGRLETLFPDRKPLYSTWEATNEADRCLYCHDAPCITACPTSIDIPTFIRKISTGNLRGSARTILEANLLGLSCARVCPVEVLCEGACVYVGWERPAIQIGRLQRFAMEEGMRGIPPILTPEPSIDKSVGLIGAGPASLACAGRLALHGYAVTLYEKFSLPGGLNATGIAPYKLFTDDALEEIRFIESLGVTIRTGVEVGRDITADDLLGQHDAVFLGPGLGADSKLAVPGEDGPGVVGATDWIRRLKIDPALSVEDVGSAIVVGGGNTAVDVARELAGLGVPSVTLIYRRSLEQMKAYRHELSRAREEGVVLIQETAVVEVLRDAGPVTGVRLAPTDDGRPVEGSEGEIGADLVVMAIGQERLRDLAAMFPGVMCDDRGRIVVDPETYATGNPRVFAGGDAVNGGKEVVNAVHEGQTAADSILRLGGTDA